MSMDTLNGAQALGTLMIFSFGTFLMLPPTLWMRHFWFTLVPAVILVFVELYSDIPGESSRWLLVHALDALASPGGIVYLLGYLVAYVVLRFDYDDNRLDTWFTAWGVTMILTLLAGSGSEAILTAAFGGTRSLPMTILFFLLGALLVLRILSISKIESEYPYIIKGWDSY